MNGQTAYERRHFDTLRVAVRADKLGEVAECYRCFRWEETERREDARYDNIVQLTFRRPHKVANKDRLQLLQVGMEEDMNRLAAAERNKHALSTVFGLTAGMLAAALLCGGIALALLLHAAWAITLGIVLALLGGAGIALTAVLEPKIVRNENILFVREEGELRRRIGERCARAMELTEEENGR